MGLVFIQCGNSFDLLYFELHLVSTSVRELLNCIHALISSDNTISYPEPAEVSRNSPVNPMCYLFKIILVLRGSAELYTSSVKLTRINYHLCSYLKILYPKKYTFTYNPRRTPSLTGKGSWKVNKIGEHSSFTLFHNLQ